MWVFLRHYLSLSLSLSLSVCLVFCYYQQVYDIFNMSCLAVILRVRGRDGMFTPQNDAVALCHISDIMLLSVIFFGWSPLVALLVNFVLDLYVGLWQDNNWQDSYWHVLTLLLTHIVCYTLPSYRNKSCSPYVFVRVTFYFLSCCRCIKVSFSKIAVMAEVTIFGQTDFVL